MDFVEKENFIEAICSTAHSYVAVLKQLRGCRHPGGCQVGDNFESGWPMLHPPDAFCLGGCLPACPPYGRAYRVTVWQTSWRMSYSRYHRWVWWARGWHIKGISTWHPQEACKLVAGYVRPQGGHARWASHDKKASAGSRVYRPAPL